MHLKQFFEDRRAVSPVIGVILMVAITVILAAVIGTFVLGLGDQVQNTTPQAQFGFDQTNQSYSQDGVGSQEARTVTITHESGDTVSESDLTVTVAGNNAYDVVNFDDTSTNRTQAIWNESGDVSAGSSVRVVVFETGTASIGDGIAFDGTGGQVNDTANYGAIFPGDTVRVIYDSPDSDKSSTLAKREVQ